jgi:hypothetical protein
VRVVGLGVVTAAAVVFLPADPALACSCLDLTEAQLITLADAVFIGSVDESEFTDEARAARRAIFPERWIFEVDEVYRGEVYARQSVVSPSGCGVNVIKCRTSSRHRHDLQGHRRDARR